MKKALYEVSNDGNVVARASSKPEAVEIANDLPCFCRSSVEIKKVKRKR